MGKRMTKFRKVVVEVTERGDKLISCEDVTAELKSRQVMLESQITALKAELSEEHQENKRLRRRLRLKDAA